MQRSHLRSKATLSGLILAASLTATTAFAQGLCGEWTVFPTPNPPTGNSAIIGLGAWSPDFAYALRGGAAGRFVHQWDGTSWTEAELPTLAVEGSFSPRAITAAGGQAWIASLVTEGGGGPAYQHLLRWNGTEWDLEEWVELVPDVFGGRRTGSPEDMDGSSANDIWIVGIAEGTGDPNAGNELLTVHWDGNELTEYSTSGPGGRQNWLTGVKVLAPDNAWSVGYYNNTGDGGAFRAMVYHWDGTSWTRVQQPAEALVQAHFNDIDGTGPNDLWAVGDHLGDPLLMHYDGTEWTITPAPEMEYNTTVYQVAAASPDNVWAATTSHMTGFLHWDGSTWEAKDFPTVPGTTSVTLHGGMAAVGECDIWAAGGQTIDGRIYTIAARLGLGSETSSVEGNFSASGLQLLQNSPNPFGSETRIGFTLPAPSDVMLEVFNPAGRLVHVVRDESIPAGTNSIEFNAGSIPAGTYYYRVTADGVSETRRMVHVR